MMDDLYLNGWAKKCGWQATLVYNSLCRHADRVGESFPSIRLIAEEHRVSEDTISRGIKSLLKCNIISLKKKRGRSGKWLNNVYILMDKSVWNDNHTAISGMAPHRSQRLTTPLLAENHTAISGTKDTHSKDTHIRKEKRLKMLADMKASLIRDGIIKGRG